MTAHNERRFIVGWLLTYGAFRSDTSRVDPHGEVDALELANRNTERDFKNLADGLPNRAVAFYIIVFVTE